ncbi:hypothetical protein [Streptomyces umbrinus]|uniref:hypothetical protein n=1 Tax=Streptomyces umbrinus TaxID=67370 RepID=UPI003411C44F
MKQNPTSAPSSFLTDSAAVPRPADAQGGEAPANPSMRLLDNAVWAALAGPHGAGGEREALRAGDRRRASPAQVSEE